MTLARCHPAGVLARDLPSQQIGAAMSARLALCEKDRVCARVPVPALAGGRLTRGTNGSEVTTWMS
jgi:hypothetical protein